ncbi:hypothetical protein OsI_00972 [Oryza sativa Indica Group]|uniref:Late embryogenesis abundant protein LEA-2 subgroup domain-containing protein n=1 Tax=Oryza sativa subsp. indica TaxID=39946 RepID=A2WMA0_ORYSI|nr:hypothetical protein OsI_00972 [Oryza sativa Indica Group]
MAQLVDKAKGFVADKVARVEKPEAELAELSFQSVGRGGATLAGRVDVPYDFLVSLARDAGRDWDIDYEMRVGLTVDLPILGNFTLPLTKSGELKLPTLSDVF